MVAERRDYPVGHPDTHAGSPSEQVVEVVAAVVEEVEVLVEGSVQNTLVPGYLKQVDRDCKRRSIDLEVPRV